MKEGRFTWKARGRSFIYAWDGIVALIKGEHNARIHCVGAVLAVIAGIVFHISPVEWAIVMVCIGGVFAAEAFNSAIEALGDRFGDEHSELVGKAKDIAAGGVLLFVVGAVAAAAFIFIPRIIDLFR